MPVYIQSFSKNLLKNPIALLEIVEKQLLAQYSNSLPFHVPGPNGPANCSIDQQADGTHIVTYIPSEAGMYDVRVLWNGDDIPGMDVTIIKNMLKQITRSKRKSSMCFFIQ